MRTVIRKTAIIQYFFFSIRIQTTIILEEVDCIIWNAILISSNKNIMVFRFYVTLHWWTWILIWLGLILLLLIAFPKWFFVDGRICFCFHHHESTNENEDINHAKIKEEKIKRLHDKLQQRILEKISPYTKVRSVGIFLLACIFASLVSFGLSFRVTYF